jgi:hypothetical protein
MKNLSDSDLSERETRDDLEIRCSQCDEWIKLNRIVAHWQSYHGYRIYPVRETPEPQSERTQF